MTPAGIHEFERKIELVRRYAKSAGFSAVLIGRQDNFAWITSGGDNRVVRTQEEGFGILVITAAKVHLVAYSMDAARIHDDELPDAGIEVHSLRWHEGSREEKAITLCGGGLILTDLHIAGTIRDLKALTRLHYPLSITEISLARELGARTEILLRKAADRMSPDDTESDVAKHLTADYENEGMTVDVMLVGGSKRIAAYRHPLPSSSRIGDVVLLHSAVHHRGLHANVTRMVSFAGHLNKKLERDYSVLCEAQALTLSLCVPGMPFHSIFEARRRLLEQSGYPDEWELHFPGGTTGYVLAEGALGADPDAKVSDGQLFDWFITLTGVKVEELGLTSGGKRELLSSAGAWPTRPFTSGDLTLDTPWILER